MKFLYITLAVILILFVASQVYFLVYDSRIEQHTYQVVDDFGEVEIREYEPALFATVTVDGSMFDTQNKAFSKLGGYIFGGNKENRSIAMTAPVQMQDKGQQSEMKFMMPGEYSRDELPEPTDPSVRFVQQDGYYVAAIRFGGFYNQSRYEKYKGRLQEVVRQQGLETMDEYFFQGYNAPYQLFGRRNEVLVKIQYSGSKG